MRHEILYSVLLVLIATLVGALAGTVIVLRGSYESLAMNYERLHENSIMNGNKPVIYGTLIAKYADATILRVRVASRYDTGNDFADFDVDVTNADIYSQTLVAKEGVYTSLTDPEKKSANDIPAGSLLVLFLRYESHDVISAEKVYFGNPL